MSGGAGLLPSTGWSDLLRRYFPEISVWNLFPQNTTYGPERWHPNGGSRYTQYTKLYDIICIHCNNQSTLNWRMNGRTKRRRTRGFWPEVVGWHWGVGLVFCDIEPYFGWWYKLRRKWLLCLIRKIWVKHICVNSTNHFTSLWGLSLSRNPAPNTHRCS